MIEDRLVSLVCLVYRACLVEPDQPEELNKPDGPEQLAKHERREPDAVGCWRGWAAVKSEMILDTFFFPCRLVGPDLYGSRFERIHMNHPSTGLRNESPACLLTL
jgi:hypothetical protein